MKSIDYLTTEEHIATSVPFSPSRETIGIKWTDDLPFALDEEQEEEVNRLVTDIAAQTATRLVQFILYEGDKMASDKQILSRVICLAKLYDDRQGNWMGLNDGHDVSIRTVRKHRNKLMKDTGLIIR